jgi:hypothetical protein
MGSSSDWQFLQKTNDPRISMLRKFARAMKLSLSDLVSQARSWPASAARKPWNAAVGKFAKTHLITVIR